MRKTIENYLSNHNDVMAKVVELHTDTIVQIAQAIIESFVRDGKLILFGNGGSAQDAQHIAAELVGIYTMERRSLPAIALTTNTSVLTALPNDYYYHSVFERQIEGMVRPGDVVIGISTSGNAGNVIRGILKAKEIGAIGLFNDKYDQTVKVYFIGNKKPYSIEFCGGPHVDFTSKVKRFRIIKQENIGKGYRRIYAVVG